MHVASLDASKVFDRINFYKMVTSLLKRNLPVYFVNNINLFAVVMWNNKISESFKVDSVNRQGGILSPVLFILLLDHFERRILVVIFVTCILVA